MITDNYKNDLKKLHKSKAFGNRSKIPAEVTRCIEEYNIESILDFGCGKGNVVAALKETYPNLKVYGYDPGRDGYDALPDSIDMIISTDVLEHIEPELLEETLLDLAKRTDKVMYHLIACHPAKKSLSDGRMYYHIIIDKENPAEGIKELRYIDPRKLRKVREIKKQKDEWKILILDKKEELQHAQEDNREIIPVKTEKAV